MGYVLAECSVHGRVCAQHWVENVGGGGRLDWHKCPGSEHDPGVCTGGIVVPLPGSQACSSPPWAEY